MTRTSRTSLSSEPAHMFGCISRLTASTVCRNIHHQLHHAIHCRSSTMLPLLPMPRDNINLQSRHRAHPHKGPRPVRRPVSLLQAHQEPRSGRWRGSIHRRQPRLPPIGSSGLHELTSCQESRRYDGEVRSEEDEEDEEQSTIGQAARVTYQHVVECISSEQYSFRNVLRLVTLVWCYLPKAYARCRLTSKMTRPDPVKCN